VSAAPEKAGLEDMSRVARKFTETRAEDRAAPRPDYRIGIGAA
jgi:hypothetical protein